MGNSKTDLVFIQGTRFEIPRIPLGMGYIAEMLDENNILYEVCDVNLMSEDDIVEFVDKHSPAFIALSTMSYEVEKNYELLNDLRGLCPDATIILGGPHAIAAEMEIFDECPSIDLIMLGEGEDSLWQIVKKEKPFHSIPGVCTANGHTSEPVRLDLTKRKFPTYRKFDLEAYPKEIPIMSSRGCIYNCIFCGAGRFLGKKWRSVPAALLFDEFEYWYKRGYREIYFSDSLFALDKERVIAFCDAVIESGYDDVTFVADGVRADHLSVALLKRMKEAGFQRFIMGVETIHPATLKLLKKGETFKEIDSALSYIDKIGISVCIYLIAGLPKETYKDTIQSINYALKYKYITDVYIGRLTPILGTPYYSSLEAQGELLDIHKQNYPTKDSFTDFNTPNAWISSNEFQKIEKHIKEVRDFCAERRRLMLRVGALYKILPASILNAMTWLTPRWRVIRKGVKGFLRLNR